MTRDGWTYDEKRADPAPCRCGKLVTNPHYCETQGRCLFRKIPPWATTDETP